MSFTAPTRTWSRECVELILRHHLDIAEERFYKMDLEEFNKRQREAGYTGGVSWDPWTLLLVSKTWRSVGEQLLYHTVVVRSLAQAYTLMDTFREHPELAGFTRRLRFEGPYGVASSQIIHYTAPTVTDLWLSLFDGPTDAVLIQPYTVSLAWLNPRRCAIYYSAFSNGGIESDLRMWDSVAKWSNLRHLSLSSSTYHMGTISLGARASGIRTLETLELSDAPDNMPHYMYPLAMLKAITTHSANLKKIIFYNRTDVDVVKQLLEKPHVQLEDRSTPKISQFSRPFPVEILDIIIGHALLDSKPIVEHVKIDHIRSWYNRSTARSFLVVSAAFKELTLARLCRRPCISDAAKLVQFTNLIRTRNDLVQRVVGVDLGFFGSANTRDRYYGSPHRTSDLADMFALNFFLATVPNLRSIVFTMVESSPFALSLSLLSVISTLKHFEELSGASLGWTADSSILSPSTLSSFTSLRKLVKAKLVVPTSSVGDSLSEWASVFSSLQELELTQFVGPAYQTWQILEAMDLPVLRRFGCQIVSLPYANKFFTKHGAKLERLAITQFDNVEEPEKHLTALCPNLTEIELWTVPTIVYHDTVESIVVSVAEPDAFSRWIRVEASKDFKSFPALRKIQNVKLQNWDARRWQSLSSALASDRKIALVDRFGCAWRPRHSRPDMALTVDEGLRTNAISIESHAVLLPPSDDNLDEEYDSEEDEYNSDYF